MKRFLTTLIGVTLIFGAVIALVTATKWAIKDATASPTSCRDVAIKTSPASGVASGGPAVVYARACIDNGKWRLQ